MNELLGPHLLSLRGTELSTADALQGKELVLLYFSASWCAPCKAFSPILMEFYPTCQRNNVEIIFVSMDRTQSSFWEYYKTMPWSAISLDSQSVPDYSKALSTKLSIRTIPQVVVLDCKNGNGDYITKDAKLQILSARNKNRDCDNYDDVFLDLIRSWKDAPRIPLQQVNLGIVSSIFTKVQRGYQYILGYSSSSKDETTHEKNIKRNFHNLEIHSEQNEMIEDEEMLANVLKDFLREATVRLKVYPSSTQQRMNLIQKNSTHEYVVPVSLEEHSRLLLQVQLEALEDTIMRKRESNPTYWTSTDVVQEHLRSLGIKDFSRITSDEKMQQDLLTSMNEMNQHARNAFVRSVLWSEMQSIKKCEMDKERLQMVVNFETDKRALLKRNNNDGIVMDRKTVLEFCGLCNTAIKMEEVERYLKFGHDIFDSIDDENEHVASSQHLSVHQRIILLQQLMLCAVGFEPNFGGQELHRIMTSDLSNDDELKNFLASYFINMQLFAKSVGDDGDITEGLSDMKEGGVTKVVSVKYSEKSIHHDPDNDGSAGAYDAPNRARMEHNSDERQRQELKLAAKAASMQQEILDGLLNLEDAERNFILQQARESHELFVQQCMSLAPGPERVAFLQNIQPEQQKMLLIHKLWEGRTKDEVAGRLCLF